MKFLTLVSALLLSWSAQSQVFPTETEVVKTVFEQARTTSLEIRENTFIPNIQGYACPWPAINLAKYQTWNVKLNHRTGSDFGVEHMGLAITNINRQHCGAWPSAQSVFGEEFEIGKTIEFELKIVRQIIKVKNNVGGESLFLQETVSTEINGVPVSSQSRVAID